jgi:hypothetical protein
MALAEQIAADARLPRANFAELARKFSDDATSRDLGGTLGAVRADRFMLWPQLLDAIQATEKGCTSPVVETDYGFHIFKRLIPHAEERVSGQRIVINHDAAPWGSATMGHAVVHRSRQQAWDLANKVSHLARVDRVPFSELVARFSEHWSVQDSGALGSWSTLEASPFPVQLDLLGRAAAGEIVGPVETRFGYEVLRRVPAATETQIPVTSIVLRFSGSQSAEASEVSVHELAKRVSDQLMLDPGQFEALQAKFCCKGVVEVVREGSGNPGVARTVRGLKPNEIAREPIRDVSSWMIPRRLDAAALTRSAALNVELPTPQSPDQNHWIRTSHDVELVQAFATIARHASGELNLEPQVAEALTRTLDLRGKLTGLNATERVALVFQTEAAARNVLGTHLDAFRKLENRYIEQQLLSR